MQQARGKQSVAVGGDAGIVVTGSHNQVVTASPVRSAYGQQVRRLAPEELVGRDAELAALTDFCTGRSGPSYAWWRAEAWAGKTALLSWFALHPPQGVRIVPFFITARLGAQNDAVAYVDVVLEQLAELAGEGLPALLTAATREAHLLRLYGEAARACARRGERLVLLVDGLDEDRGVTTGPDAHSIASLLPTDLPVIVSGRLNPPLPADVPPGHPLQDPAIVRLLEPSPYARAIRAEAERELKRLLESAGTAGDVLALLTAAGGGLTADDLAELTGEVPYRVKDLLRTGPGRTFALVGQSYILAHEELAVHAREMLGERELHRRRGTLHTWAEEWRAKGWPEGTPEYLLRGYVSMLRTAGDLDRMLTCALDEARHDRMMEETGGDVLAFEEIRMTEEACVRAGVPDLVDVVRLVIRREELEGRNGNVQGTLPWAWASLGQDRRAEALAHSIPSLDWRALALVDIGVVYLDRGDPVDAVRVWEDAEALADLPDYSGADEWEVALAQLSIGWARAGRLDRAERLATGLVEPADRAVALPGVAGECARAGDAERVERLATAAGPAGEALVRVRVALELSWAGRGGEAAAHLARADAAVAASDTPAEVFDLLTSMGEDERARAVARTHAADPNVALAEIRWAAGRGRYDLAEELARAMDDVRHRSEALAVLVAALADTGRLDRAEALARERADEAFPDHLLEPLVESIARTGDFARARALACAVAPTDPVQHALVRGVVAAVVAAGGERRLVREAASVVAEVEARMRVARPGGSLDVLETARCLAEVGCGDEARSLLRHIEAELGLGAAEDGAPVAPLWPVEAALAARALAWAGEFDRATELMRRLDADIMGGMACRALVERLWWAEEFTRAEAVVAEAHRTGRVDLWCVLACLAADSGHLDDAERFARAAATPDERVRAWARLAVGWARADEPARARDAFARARSHAEEGDDEGGDGGAVRGDDEGGDVGAGERGDHGERDDEGGTVVRGRPELVAASFAVGEEEAGAAMLAAVVAWEDAPIWYLTRVVTALAEAGEDDRARTLARGATDPAKRDHLVGSLVRALTAAGRHDRAAECARGFGRPDDPTSVDELRSWASLALGVEPARGRLMMARLLRHEALVNVLPSVLRLEPRAVPVVVDALRRARQV
ncbi:hypothetical protein ACIPPS_04960 [Streptomyces sp. NPDC090127]|uniref:hypothetical protein n=1 Tax=Streptomyces sp. NPDC090127 TaxID=3365953 RepID=UPI003828FD40